MKGSRSTKHVLFFCFWFIDELIFGFCLMCLCIHCEFGVGLVTVFFRLFCSAVSVYPRFDCRESGGKDKCYLGILVFDVSGSERWKICY
jgi:hypothetical protein